MSRTGKPFIKVQLMITECVDPVDMRPDELGWLRFRYELTGLSEENRRALRHINNDRPFSEPQLLVPDMFPAI